MKKIIKCKNLIYDADLDPIQNAIIVVDGQFILEVGTENQISIPDNAEIIDCSNETVLPGLIDSHSHITANYIYNESQENESQENNDKKTITKYITTNFTFEKYNTKYNYFFISGLFVKLCIVD